MKKIYIIIVAIFLSGCLAGTMRGVMSDSQQVTITYEQELDNDKYTTTIDGELFEGKAVMVDSSTTFRTAFGSVYSQYGSVSGSVNSVSFTSTEKVKAVMLGDKGSSLRCLMHYADNSGFTSSGGVGECIHSDGRRIDILW
jgi:hypothetical protein